MALGDPELMGLSDWMAMGEAGAGDGAEVSNLSARENGGIITPRPRKADWER